MEQKWQLSGRQKAHLTALEWITGKELSELQGLIEYETRESVIRSVVI